MAISPYLAALREKVGTDLVLVPTVAVLPVDDRGRLLLVRQTDTDQWATIGGLIEVDESPAAAGVREAREEAGVEVAIDRLVAAIGGPDYRITYPNGDRVACVGSVFLARVVGGTPEPDGDETSDVAWFAIDRLDEVDLNDFNRALLSEVRPALEGARPSR